MVVKVGDGLVSQIVYVPGDRRGEWFLILHSWASNTAICHIIISI